MTSGFGRFGRGAAIVGIGTLGAVALPGCLVTQAKQFEVNGPQVERAELAKVITGRTSKGEVETLLGVPTTQTALPDGTEQWTWNWSESKSGAGAVLLVFGGAKDVTRHESAHVLFKDGVAVRKWRD